MTREKKIEGDSHDLPQGQFWILECLCDPRRGNGNWSGTPQGSREALVQKGLIVNTREDGRHTQHAHYKVTELGKQVMCAARFDEGLKIGYAGWVAKLEAAYAHDWEQALEENHRWDVEHGLRYRESPEVDEDVRRVIWKHVEVTP